MTQDQVDIKDLIDDLYEIDDYASEANIPQYIISGSGCGWFVDPETRFMVQVSRGTEIVPVEEVDSNRTLVRGPFNFLIIPNDEIIEIGFNWNKTIQDIKLVI